MNTQPKRAETSMSDAARKAQNEYTRRYRKEHPERVREWNRRYWQKKAMAQAAPVPAGKEVTED